MSEIFPSVKAWRGWYKYTNCPRRFWMNLRLEFCNGQIVGEGTDDIGAFSILGRFSGGDCNFKKSYVTHAVCYCGWGDGKGISGHWCCSSKLNGDFQIYPLGGDDRNENSGWVGADRFWRRSHSRRLTQARHSRRRF